MEQPTAASIDRFHCINKLQSKAKTAEKTSHLCSTDIHSQMPQSEVILNIHGSTRYDRLKKDISMYTHVHIIHTIHGTLCQITEVVGL